MMGRISRSTLVKKLKPVKKAWKSFTNKFQSKLQKFSTNPKSIKETTHRLLAYVTFRVLLLFKCLSLTSSKPSYYQKQGYLCQNQIHRAVYIDQLYSEPGGIPVQMEKKQVYAYRGETSSGVAVEKPTHLQIRRGGDSEKSVEEVWNSIVAKSPQLRCVDDAKSPQLRCVDDRAEEFIYRFREDMKIQKEKSEVEFQQMLARSSYQ